MQTINDEYIALNLERLTQAFGENFDFNGEIGASVSVWQRGKELLSLHRGAMIKGSLDTWTETTMAPVFSATKGPAASSILLALYEQGLTPQLPVGELWPLYPLPEATIAEVLSHQTGLAALSRSVDVFDHEACVKAIEDTNPAWFPHDHGYHPHTYGPILDEIMIRLTGNTVGIWWEEHIRKPLGIDVYIGLPEEFFSRVATLYPAKARPEELESPFYRQYLHSGTPIFQAFHSLIGLGTVHSMNRPEAWTCASPAFGGVASAKGLAQFYQACLGYGVNPSNQKPVFPKEVRQWMSTIIVQGEDLTMMTPTAFACGFMLDPIDPSTGKHLRHLFGVNGFGHAGAGGSHAFADPTNDLSFAYVMNHMDLSVLPGKKTQHLVNSLLGGLSN
jgi:CubicO group peptidase (beta-lactamase class C family)